MKTDVATLALGNKRGRPFANGAGEPVLPLVDLRWDEAMLWEAPRDAGWLVSQVRRFVKQRKRLLAVAWIEERGAFLIERASKFEEDDWCDRGRPQPF